jgi:hypothetical protein
MSYPRQPQDYPDSILLQITTLQFACLCQLGRLIITVGKSYDRVLVRSDRAKGQNFVRVIQPGDE